MIRYLINTYHHFYPRSPCGERPIRKRQVIPIIHFYPRSPCGERHSVRIMIVSSGLFLSTLSLRRATHQSDYLYLGRQFLSTLSLRRATRKRTSIKPIFSISIHALLAESDSKSAQNSGALLRIWNKFYGDCIFMLTGKAVFYPFCPCFFHIFWCEGSGNFMIAFPSH